jgi:hypothetical protein
MWLNSMVYGIIRYDELVKVGVYRSTNITGGHHPVLIKGNICSVTQMYTFVVRLRKSKVLDFFCGFTGGPSSSFSSEEIACFKHAKLQHLGLTNRNVGLTT